MLKSFSFVIVLLFNLILLGCNFNIEKKIPFGDQHQNHNMKVVTSTSKTLSPKKYAMANVGDAHIHIEYSAPSVRGRIIYGGLLAYGEVWQSGAHNATWIETNKDIILNENLLKAGKYGFFTIPNKDKWTIIFNENWNQHGKDDYNESEDVLRFDVTPKISKKITEQLIYHVERINDQEGTISLSWEKVLVKFSFVLSQT
tara:strand:- start:266 stop:865 length:600 start_codon:yes stop_codon:yes gene_type:complete